MGTQFLDIVIGRCTSRKLDNFTMFRFVAFFACLAVAAAEPQWVYPQAVDAAHLKTPSGDTVSVQAHKIQHHQLKVDEYAKKGYVPYANKMVAAPMMPAYTNGIYSPYGLRHLYKREADSDSQVFYTNPYGGNQYVNNVYNTAGVYGGYAGLTGYTFPYSTYGKIQSITTSTRLEFTVQLSLLPIHTLLECTLASQTPTILDILTLLASVMPTLTLRCFTQILLLDLHTIPTFTILLRFMEQEFMEQTLSTLE